MGLGNKLNATRQLEDHELEKLRESGYFSTDNAKSLQRFGSTVKEMGKIEIF